MKRIAIIGAGQSGLQLGLGLLSAGYQVTLYSDRSGDEIQHGHVMSSQCMFDSALETERDLGLNYWEEECPKVEGISFAVPNPVGGRVIDWAARLDNFAQSVDQRLKIPRWMAEFQKRGGNLQIEAADIDDLESCARGHDLVIVASGKGTIAQLFERDTSRSPFSEPQRSLALTYVRKMRPREPYAAVCFNLIPNVGEYFVFPALTTSGPCEIMVFEGVPGGPMDGWSQVETPAGHLACSKRMLDCAEKISAVASAFVNGFDDPRTLFPWFMDEAEAEAFVQKEAKAVAERFERRDYRKALGQFATGVTVVTARASDGRKVGVTVNSFSSVSLDPPLILWSLSRQTPSFIDFTNATHFAVNVLESRQHHL